PGSAVLADLGICRLARHAANMARDPGFGRIVRRSSICDLKLLQSVACRRWCVADFHGMPDRFPQAMAAEETVAVSGAAREGRVRVEYADGVRCGRKADNTASVGGTDAVDYRLRDPADLGHGLVQGGGQSVRQLDVCGP